MVSIGLAAGFSLLQLSPGIGNLLYLFWMVTDLAFAVTLLVGVIKVGLISAFY